MDIRYSTGKEPFKRMTTDELRSEFLISSVFNPDDVSAVYSHVDRIVTMGAMPVKERLDIEKNIDPWKNFGVTYLLERREMATEWVETTKGSRHSTSFSQKWMASMQIKEL